MSNSSNLVIEVVRKRDSKADEKQEIFLQKVATTQSELETASSSVKKPDTSEMTLRTKSIRSP